MEGKEKITLIFTIIGGILWGIIGLFNYNPLESLFNNMLIIPRIIYIIVGICALVNIGLLFDHIEK